MHIVASSKRLEQTGRLAHSRFCQTIIPVFQSCSQIISQCCHFLQVILYLGKFFGGESPHLLTGCAASIENFKDSAEFVQGESYSQCLPDHSHSLDCVFRILAIAVA